MPKSVVCFAVVTCLCASGAGWAAPVLTQEQAADRVHSEGFGLISKADQALGTWDVWASKDGIPYEIRIDAESGLVLAAIPAQDND